MDFMDDNVPVCPYCNRCKHREELSKSDIFASLSQLFNERLAEIGGTAKIPNSEQRGFRNRLKHQIEELCHCKPKSEFIQRFTECVEDLVIPMEAEVKTSHSLKLAEAYHRMSVASKDVAKIVSPVFQKNWKKAYSLSISIFYNRVFKPHKPQLAQNPEIKQIEEEIGEFIQVDGPNPLQDMGIEELVSYINPPIEEKKQRKKKKNRQKQEDFVVESFKKKLNEEVPPVHKLVPLIDHNYINKWRDRLVRTKSFTNN